MAKIGSFAHIVFEVSPKRILTFDGLKRKGDSRWAEHEVISFKPIPEFVGQTLDDIILPILLRAEAGVDPKEELDKLREYKDSGQVSYLVLGGDSVSSSQWFIASMSEAHKIYDGKGRLITAEVELTLREYPKSGTTTSRPKPKLPSPPPPSKREPIGTATIKASLLNVRMGPSLQAKIKRTAKNGEELLVYGTVTTDITWYDVGSGLYISANSNYVSYKKGV